GVLAAGEAQAMVDAYRDKLDQGALTTELAAPDASIHTVDWSPFLKGTLADETPTSVLRRDLDELAKRITTLPADLTLHPRVAKIYQDRQKMAAGELPGD